MDNLTREVKYYLHSTFSTDLIYIDTEPSVSIPIQLRKYCTIHLGMIRGVTFNLIFMNDDRLMHGDFKNLLKKLISSFDNSPVILVFSKNSKRSPDHFISQHIGHIIPNKRCYIPQFLLDVTSTHESFTPPLGSRPLSALATLITCQYLEGDLARVSPSSKIYLEVSRTSKSKALKEMESLGLITIEKNGRINIIHFQYDRLNQNCVLKIFLLFVNMYIFLSKFSQENQL